MYQYYVTMTLLKARDLALSSFTGPTMPPWPLRIVTEVSKEPGLRL